MSNELVDYKSREVIDTLKATVAKGASDAQLAQFVEVCKATGLNPFLREIWCIAATNTIMTSRDGYLTVANRSPHFDGMETAVERDDKGWPVKAVCTVWRKDRSHPVKCEAYFNEYNKPASQVWKQYPSAMIMKVAEALALKRSFAINGLVTQEEISEEPSVPTTTSPASLPLLLDDPGERTMTHEELAPVVEAIQEELNGDERTMLDRLQVATRRVADAISVSHDEAAARLFDNKDMTFDKIAKLKTPKQLERAKKALVSSTAILMGNLK